MDPFITLLQECDGFTAIEDLQQHQNDTVYEKAVHLIDTYFGAPDDDENVELAPKVEGNTFGFGLSSSSSATAKQLFSSSFNGSNSNSNSSNENNNVAFSES